MLDSGSQPEHLLELCHNQGSFFRYLYKNEIERIDSRAFDGLPKLEQLYV